ncbi:MAG: ChbG/HpnK family deacetylase [Methylomonas sp.]|jgi:predicted glycoside hydrolase/deacetylase ChbG (UPF0249 family)
MAARASIRLIVNADDYGYYPCISRGILDAAKAGKVNATGILATSPDLTAQLAWLDTVAALEAGVHLTLTHGQPLTAELAARFESRGGRFPNAYSMSLLLLSKQIGIRLIRNEWQAQIEACGGRKLMFLNSHEHIHMLPELFTLTLELAKDYQIPYVRFCRPDRLWPITGASLFRNTAMQCLAAANRFRQPVSTPVFLGLSASCNLNITYLNQVFARLKPGSCYELMCHPGYFSSTEITDFRLIEYHHWQQELGLLLSNELEDLYSKYGIYLSGYNEP